VMPAVAAICLFVAALFGVLLPAFERSLLERKRELIRELTRSARSILAEYEREERAGRLTRAEAQALAKERIAGLRYGREGKDYFWLQDLHPRMVMHPYRPDLNGQDLSDFRDLRGARIFVEFADLVRQKGGGYIEYVWQWKDDPKRLAPKESYIEGFEPWGWIVGTGMYIEDVREEISRIKRKFAALSLLIAAAVAIFLVYLVWQSSRLESERNAFEAQLRESHERYRSLVEASQEGTLLVLDGRSVYANPTFLRLLGYGSEEIGFLEFDELLPRAEDNAAAHEALARIAAGEEPGGGFVGILRRRDGRHVECALAASAIAMGDKRGFILLAKEVRPAAPGGTGEGDFSLHLAQMARSAPVALLCAYATKVGTVVAMNESATSLWRNAIAEPRLPLLFAKEEDYLDFLAELRRSGSAERRVSDAASRILHLRARLERAEGGSHDFAICAVEDITGRERQAAEREALVEKLQTTLLFLHDASGHLSREALICYLSTSIRQTAAMMAERNTDAALVRSAAGEIVGIVTDRDLRLRVLAGEAAPSEPIYRIMSAPLVSLPAVSPLYAALLRMQEKGIQHLALTEEDGSIRRLLHGRDVLHFENYGPAVITRELLSAAAAEEVVRTCRRTPTLAKSLLRSGAQ
ncbi:MAG: cache domain-containing protein, partial [Planctomycetota bacterium]|nr:cache domain-containing protein [Planctomycetota bacterium]